MVKMVGACGSLVFDCGNVMRSFGLDRQSLQEGGDSWRQFYSSNRIINGDGWILFQIFRFEVGEF